MGIVNGINIVNNLLAGTLSGAQLQTSLAVGANAASWVQVVAIRRQIQVLRNAPAAVTAVTASATASSIIAANDTAVRQWLLQGTSYSWRSFSNVAAVLASAPAMSEVSASPSAVALIAGSSAVMAAVIGAPTALSAIVASSTAMGVLAASSTAMTALVASSTAMTALVASSVAMTAIAASGTAMPILAASNTAMTAVAASSTAMAALVANSTAMATAAASSTAKMSFFGNDVALAAIAGSSTALGALRAAAAYAVTSNGGATTAQPIPGAVAGGSYILVGVSCGASGSLSINPITTRRSGSTRPITVASSPVAGTDATAITMCTPLVSPFTYAANVSSYTWYFGMLRCDI